MNGSKEEKLKIKFIFQGLGQVKGVAKGGGKGEIPPKPKKCCRKVVLFPKALILVTNFPK